MKQQPRPGAAGIEQAFYAALRFLERSCFASITWKRSKSVVDARNARLLRFLNCVVPFHLASTPSDFHRAFRFLRWDGGGREKREWRALPLRSGNGRAAAAPTMLMMTVNQVDLQLLHSARQLLLLSVQGRPSAAAAAEVSPRAVTSSAVAPAAPRMRHRLASRSRESNAAATLAGKEGPDSRRDAELTFGCS